VDEITKCPASGQSSTGMKKMPMPEPVLILNKGDQFRYQNAQAQNRYVRCRVDDTCGIRLDAEGQL
jgi:hypothetical protein